MDLLVEGIFYGILAADCLLFFFFCALCLRAARASRAPREAVLSAVVSEACPTSDESRPSSTS